MSYDESTGPETVDYRDYFDPVIDDFQHKLSIATSRKVIITVAGEMIQYFERVLQSADTSKHWLIFFEIAHVLSDRICDTAMWDFIGKIALTANATRQEQMRIAILELVPEDPVLKEDLFRLWDLWVEPKTRWAVTSAYMRQMERMPEHRNCYVKHCQESGKPVPSFELGL